MVPNKVKYSFTDHFIYITLRGKDHLEDLTVDGRIILLKCILEKDARTSANFLPQWAQRAPQLATVNRGEFVGSVKTSNL
jgi:hypothetical protein